MITLGGKEYAESPLEGAVLCCTSISPEDRAQLAEYAQDMGAKHTLDLTSDVTHLLVGSTNSEKYQYVAKNREDVKVLLPEWVHAIRRMWMADEVIDLNAMDAQYKCPTLYGLKICITGFEDLDFRTELARNIAKHGGEYTGDLTKDVTHLIAFIPHGKKYEYAGLWGLKVVSLKWYKDTLDRGMQLDESLYHPAMSPEQQGNGAWNRQPPGSSRLGKRQRPDSISQEPSRKLRRAASAKFGSQNHDMWSDIVGAAPAANSNAQVNKLRTANSVPDFKQEDSLVADPRPNLTLPPRKDSSARISIAHAHSQEGFLANKHFAQKGFDEPRKALLFAALAGHGAVLYQTITDLLRGVEDDHRSHFLIVPYDIASKQLITIQKTLPNTIVVTELWLEYCMTVKAFVPPESYALASPICPTEIPGIARLTINASGFHQVQTMHIAKTIKKLGATYLENFTPKTSVLVTNSNNPNQQKIAHATAWKVPVVTEEWVWKLIATNRIPSFHQYAVSAHNLDDINEPAENSRGPAGGVTEGRRTELDDVDSFVEAADAIEAREQQAKKEQRTNEGKDRQQHASTGREEPKRTADLEQQTTRDSPLPLQEMSTNIMSKAPRSGKKKLFRQFDGAHSDQIEPREIITGAQKSHEGMIIRPATVSIASHEDMPIMFNDDDDVQPQNAMSTASASVSASVEVKHQVSGDLLKDFFEVKAAAEARRSAMAASDSKSKRKKNLLGRAISNLSNSSRKSTEDSTEADKSKQPLSRASSINSVNTDGLGVPLSALSRIPSELIANNAITFKPRRDQPASLTGVATQKLARAAADPSITNRNTVMDSSTTDADTSFHAALATLSTSQLPHPPSPTQRPQLTYAATDEAAKLRAHLAEKRRNRARQGPTEGDYDHEMTREENERKMLELAREESEEMRQARWREEREREKGEGRLIRDDERVVGVGRRTRGREKRVSAVGGVGGEFGEELGGGKGVFEGM